MTTGIFKPEVLGTSEGESLKTCIAPSFEQGVKIEQFSPSKVAQDSLPQVDVVDQTLEAKKQALVDDTVPQEAKLSYAMQLADAGMTDFNVTDASGKNRQIHIEAPTKGESGTINVVDSADQTPMLKGRIAADDTLTVDQQYLQPPPAGLSEAQRYAWNERRIHALDTLDRLRAKQRDSAYYANQDAMAQSRYSESRVRSGSGSGGGSGRTGGSGGFTMGSNQSSDSGSAGDWPRVPAMRLDMPQAGNGPQGAMLSNGMISFANLRGCRVDTDGSGAWRHTEDSSRQSQTSLKINGRSLDTDKDNFVALPSSVREKYGIHVGDKGFLIRQDTQQAVPVVFGDVSPERHWNRGEPEASCAALRSLGFENVSGANGVDKDYKFQLVVEPDSRHKSSADMMASLNQVTRPNTGIA